jgi:photosystem II stability/assembly factor-like uncharacterized protein
MGSASVQQSEDGTGPMNLSFVDGRHGWLRVTSRLPGQRAEEETGTLLRTSNGGRTWERLPDAPTPGGIRFVTRQRGWQSWLDALWETHDHGRTWTTRRSGLAGRDFTATYGMTFPGATSGWLLSAFLDGCGPGCDSKGAVLSTRSAGRSWAVVFPDEVG